MLAGSRKPGSKGNTTKSYLKNSEIIPNVRPLCNKIFYFSEKGTTLSSFILKNELNKELSKMRDMKIVLN